MTMQPLDLFHLPPHCRWLEVVEELTPAYGGESEIRRVRCWYDATLNEFHNELGGLRGEVRAWKVSEEEQ